MAQRRTQVELAEQAEAKVRKEKARLKYDVLRLKRDAVKSRRRMLSVHRAARQNRFTKDWIAPATSADSAIIPDMPRLNNRARQMVRDDAWSKSIIRAFRRNVVGTGITAALDDKPYRQAWREWSRRPENIDIERKRNLHMVEQWAIDEMITVGEAFVVRWILGKGSGRRLVLQCYEVEQLDNYKITEPTTGNEVRRGVEIDEWGAPVAYHFFKDHPNDVVGMSRPHPMTMDSMRVPAHMVSHIFDPERVRQSHGVTRLGPVLNKLRDLAEYDATQLRVARAEASIGIIINSSETGDGDDEPLELDGLNVAYVNEGEEVTQFAPTRPGNQYDPFVTAQLRAIAAGVGLSYDQIARDFDNGSYSSKRQSNIEDQREWSPMQEAIIIQLCEPVMRDFLFVWAMQNPEQSGDYFFSDQVDPIRWQGQGWEWFNPLQQGQGVEQQMRLGLTTRTIEANKLGRTVKELDAQMDEDGTRELIAQRPGKPNAIGPTLEDGGGIYQMPDEDRYPADPSAQRRRTVGQFAYAPEGGSDA